MISPDDFEDTDSVWARLEREDREDAKRASRPLMLIWTGVFLVSLPGLTRLLGEPLEGAAFWVVIGVGLGLGLVGLIGYRSSRPRP